MNLGVINKVVQRIFGYV